MDENYYKEKYKVAKKEYLLLKQKLQGGEDDMQYIFKFKNLYNNRSQTYYTTEKQIKSLKPIESKMDNMFYAHIKYRKMFEEDARDKKDTGLKYEDNKEKTIITVSMSPKYLKGILRENLIYALMLMPFIFEFINTGEIKLNIDKECMFSLDDVYLIRDKIKRLASNLSLNIGDSNFYLGNLSELYKSKLYEID
jgi:hypothetical protein